MIKKMEHTAIIVGDMDETIHYYGDMFGFKVRLQGSTEKKRDGFFVS
ncbi:VOC family protein [Priestia megaterium]